MLPARTPTDPLCVNASLDLMEMVKNAQVNTLARISEMADVSHITSLSYINDTGCALGLPRAVL